MLARVDNTRAGNPGYKEWHDAQAARREAEPQRHRIAALQAQTMRMRTITELGKIVAERHRQLRQARS